MPHILSVRQESFFRDFRNELLRIPKAPEKRQGIIVNLLRDFLDDALPLGVCGHIIPGEIFVPLFCT
jgi:hypothetical protein